MNHWFKITNYTRCEKKLHSENFFKKLNPTIILKDYERKHDITDAFKQFFYWLSITNDAIIITTSKYFIHLLK